MGRAGPACTACNRVNCMPKVQREREMLFRDRDDMMIEVRAKRVPMDIEMDIVMATNRWPTVLVRLTGFLIQRWSLSNN